MLETGNWVNLLDSYTSPFWAKPPLYSWLSAASMSVLGVSEFALRLPSLILGLLTLYLVYGLVAAQLNKEKAMLAVLVLFSSAGFLVSSATVMTDPGLLFSVTLSLCAWWHHHQKNDPKWAYLFFIGIALGLVAKGPLSLVLIGSPIFVYLVIRGGWIKAIKELPWITGIFIGFGLPALWYIAAEARTPGFLEYFLLGEHVYRFIKPGWTGDLYGNAHEQAKGMIWIYAAIALLPWSLFLVGILGKVRKTIVAKIKGQEFSIFLLCWALTHLCFFSLPANIIWPYYLPMAPAFAMLIAILIGDEHQWSRYLSYLAVAITSIAVIFVSYKLESDPVNHLKSGIAEVQLWKDQKPDANSELLYLSGKRLFSVEFYSSGKAKLIKSEEPIKALLQNKTQDYVLIDLDAWEKISPEISRNFTPVEKVVHSNLNLILIQEKEQSKSQK
jgi:4-amino-4-deoxy-L-arabinose transferase-like glycosyltransferase